MSENDHGGSALPCLLAFIVGSLLGAAWLNDASASSQFAMDVLNFGNWLSSFTGLSGYIPALLTASLLIGLCCYCCAAAVVPRFEEWVASRGAERAKRALLKEGKISVEDEMKALVRKFGRKKPV